MARQIFLLLMCSLVLGCTDQHEPSSDAYFHTYMFENKSSYNIVIQWEKDSLNSHEMILDSLEIPKGSYKTRRVEYIYPFTPSDTITIFFDRTKYKTFSRKKYTPKNILFNEVYEIVETSPDSYYHKYTFTDKDLE